MRALYQLMLIGFAILMIPFTLVVALFLGILSGIANPVKLRSDQ